MDLVKSQRSINGHLISEYVLLVSTVVNIFHYFRVDYLAANNQMGFALLLVIFQIKEDPSVIAVLRELGFVWLHTF